MPRLYLPAEGYDEYLVNARLDEDWTIHDPELVDVSSESHGIPYDPKEVLEQLFEMPYSALLHAAGYQSLGPLDAIDTLALADIDPRRVVHEDGRVSITPEQREKFEKTMEDLKGKDAPPQVSAADKLAAYLQTEPPE